MSSGNSVLEAFDPSILLVEDMLTMSRPTSLGQAFFRKVSEISHIPSNNQKTHSADFGFNRMRVILVSREVRRMNHYAIVVLSLDKNRIEMSTNQTYH